jgi:hypothetical protein
MSPRNCYSHFIYYPMKFINSSGKAPLYQHRCKEQVLPRSSQKRKAETHQIKAVKLLRLCYNLKQKQEDNSAIIYSFKHTRLDEDQEEVLFGLYTLESHDGSFCTCHDVDIDMQIGKSLHLGSIWFPNSVYGVFR